MRNDLTSAVSAKDEGRVVEVARRILALDPTPALTSGSPTSASATAKNLRATAISALLNFNRLEAYALDMEKLARADPGALAKAWRAADTRRTVAGMLRSRPRPRVARPPPRPALAQALPHRRSLRGLLLRRRHQLDAP